MLNKPRNKTDILRILCIQVKDAYESKWSDMLRNVSNERSLNKTNLLCICILMKAAQSKTDIQENVCIQMKGSA